MAFDRMKIEFGYKEFKKMVKQKIRPIQMDIVSDYLLYRCIICER